MICEIGNYICSGIGNFISTMIAPAVIILILFGLIKATEHFSPRWKHYTGRKKRAYYLGLDSNEYITWRDRILENMYGKEQMLKISGRKYPVFCLSFEKSKDGATPDKIDSICKLSFSEEHPGEGVKGMDKNSNVIMKPLEELDVFNAKDSNDRKRIKKLRNKYAELVSSSIKRPTLVGFMLDSIKLNKKKEVTAINVKLGTYEQNVYTSHVLEYELYCAYKELRGKKDVTLEELVPLLPFRRHIQPNLLSEKFDPVKALLDGSNRLSLFSVQCIVVFKDHWHTTECTFLKKRSENPDEVAAKLGYYQILPAGGFELCENEKSTNLNIIQQNCSLTKALFREYLEEIFNCREFQGEEKDKRWAIVKILGGWFWKKVMYSDRESEKVIKQKTADDIMSQKEVRHIINLIHKGKARFELLGLDIDMVSLRPMVNFVLEIDDLNYWSRDFVLNTEFKHNGDCVVSMSDVERRFNSKTDNITQDTAALYYQYKCNLPR